MSNLSSRDDSNTKSGTVRWDEIIDYYRRLLAKRRGWGCWRCGRYPVTRYGHCEPCAVGLDQLKERGNKRNRAKRARRKERLRTKQIQNGETE